MQVPQTSGGVATATQHHVRRRIRLITLLATLMVGSLVVVPAATVAAGPREMGIHVPDADATAVGQGTFKEHLSSREVFAGRRLDIVSTFRYGFGAAFPDWREEWIRSTGHQVMINWGIGYTPAIEAGRKDAVFAARGQSLSAFGDPVKLRFAPSMDAGEYGTNVTSPESFVNAWRRAHDVVTAQGATNVDWVWCPSAASWAAGTAMSYYPGAAYVDTVCAEGMNSLDGWKTFEQMFEPFQSAAGSLGKPLMIGSFGTTEGTISTSKAGWISAAFVSLANNLSGIKTAIYEDTDLSSLSTNIVGPNRWKAGITQPALYTPPAVALPTGPLVPATGALLGSMQPQILKSTEQQEWSEFETLSHRKMDIAHTSYGWGSAFPTWREPFHAENGRIPLVSWGVVDTYRINNGSQDAYIRQIADSVKDFNGPMMIRWFWEMDGASNAMKAGSPAEYKAAWNRIRSTFTARGATNAVWVWAPNAYGFTNGAAPPYYPGDDQVDWIAADGYNFFPLSGATPTSFTTVFTPFYQWAMTHNKPLMIAESGSVEGPGADDKAMWIREMAKAKALFPGIRAIVYVNQPLPSHHDDLIYDWQVSTSGNAQNAWIAMAVQHYYRHNG